MATIDVLPSIEIIRGFKGILDFYVWRGLPCVRAWPKYRPARQTDASLAAALLFGAVIKAFALTYGLVLDQLELEATGIPRTTRDIYVSGVYGNLHEASMSDFLTLLTECRDALVILTAINDALHSIATDAWDVHVHASVLPPDAATHTGQGTQLTALQKIDDLQDALESKALDRLLVRGMDQLLSFKATLESSTHGPLDGNDGFYDGPTVPAGEVWDVTTITSVLIPRALTAMIFHRTTGGLNITLVENRRAIAASEYVSWTGHTWLQPGDLLRVHATGGLDTDDIYLMFTGKRMTLET